MRRACPYRGENPVPGKDVHGELDPRPGIREQPRPIADISLLLLPATQPDRIHPFDAVAHLPPELGIDPSGMVTMPRIPMALRAALFIWYRLV